jgi:hypothetical protein
MAITTNRWFYSLEKTSASLAGIAVSVLIPALLGLFFWFTWELGGLLPFAALCAVRSLLGVFLLTLIVNFCFAFFGRPPAISDDETRPTSPWSALLPFLGLVAAPILLVALVGYFHRQNGNAVDRSGLSHTLAGNSSSTNRPSTYFQTPLLSFTEKAVDQVMDSL